MKQCLDVFYFNSRNTTILEEKLNTISWFPSELFHFFSSGLARRDGPFINSSVEGADFTPIVGAIIVIGFLRKIK